MHRVTSLCLPRRTLISHCGTESFKVRGHCQIKRNVVSLCQQTPSPAGPFLGHTVISYSKLFHSSTQHSQSAQMRCRFMQTHGWIRIMTSGYIPLNILFGREPLRLRIWPSRLCFAFPLVGHFAKRVRVDNLGSDFLKKRRIQLTIKNKNPECACFTFFLY